MNGVGIVRNLDSLGRIVIPKEMRKKLELNEGEPVTITDGDNVIIIKNIEKDVFSVEVNLISGNIRIYGYAVNVGNI